MLPCNKSAGPHPPGKSCPTPDVFLLFSGGVLQVPRNRCRQLPRGRPQALVVFWQGLLPLAIKNCPDTLKPQSSHQGAGQAEQQQRRPPFRLSVTSCYWQTKNSAAGGPCFARLSFKQLFLPLHRVLCLHEPVQSPRRLRRGKCKGSNWTQAPIPRLCLIVKFVFHSSLFAQSELFSRRFLHSPKQTERSPEGHTPVSSACPDWFTSQNVTPRHKLLRPSHGIHTQTLSFTEVGLRCNAPSLSCLLKSNTVSCMFSMSFKMSYHYYINLFCEHATNI